MQNYNEVFKVCVEFWSELCSQLLEQREAARLVDASGEALSLNDKLTCWFQRTASNTDVFSVDTERGVNSPSYHSNAAAARFRIYRKHLSDVCAVYLERMACPVLYREVLDEFGEKHLEVASFGDEPPLYDPMRNTLRCFATLDYNELKAKLGDRVKLLQEHATCKQLRSTVSDSVLIDEFRRVRVLYFICKLNFYKN